MSLKLFQCLISHVTTPETEIIFFRLLNLFQHYLSDVERVGEYSRAAISLQNSFEIIFIAHVTTAYRLLLRRFSQ